LKGLPLQEILQKNMPEQPKQSPFSQIKKHISQSDEKSPNFKGESLRIDIQECKREVFEFNTQDKSG
jgi:hypothetical protein